MLSDSSTIKHSSMTATAAGPFPVNRQQCLRCGGLLVLDHCLDLLNVAGQLDVDVMRCVQCGDIIDRVILHHRSMQRGEQVHRMSLKGFQGAAQTPSVVAAESGRRIEVGTY